MKQKLNWLIIMLTSMVLTTQAQIPQDFIHANGSALVHGSNNDTIYLRGINFNNFWLDDGGPNWIIDDPNDMGTPQPYAFGDLNWFADAKQIRFNVVRVTLNYRLFEDNANPYVYLSSGWNFIDQYIQWADSLGMYLILDMHVPQGGLQNSSNAPLLWTNNSNQDRLVALWHEIATRYSNDTTIAGFDLLNEPTPVDSIAAWSNLAQRIADTIRTVDNNHLLIVEYAYGIIDTTNTWYPFWNLSQQMFFINDTNVMYDFHYYQEMSYALQCYNNPNCTPTIQYNDNSVIFPTESGNSLPFTQAWLADDLTDWLTVYDSANVPVNIGEWAPWRANYEYNNNQMQGYEYISDLLDLFCQQKLNWQYYCYSEFRHTSQDQNGNDGLNSLLSNYYQSNLCNSITTDIENQHLEQEFIIYPNPFKDMTTIKAIDFSFGNADLKLYDLIGRQIMHDYHINGNAIVIERGELTKGIYLYKLTDNKGLLITGKIIAE